MLRKFYRHYTNPLEDNCVYINPTQVFDITSSVNCVHVFSSYDNSTTIRVPTGQESEYLDAIARALSFTMSNDALRAGSFSTPMHPLEEKPEKESNQVCI